ncbi:PREDICTED: uncharacterized protein C11orf24 homolog [Elephantulus edwardii]|uniref:uncharacterized protein C11orf24 homolog n=1 Tax=Elephantulus edwardii TaxID=28737 RepID=UPI0003F06BCF|nr:PREDICTED: uncharacterized protein C11orf24 homolog [Elephantulus edwardii]
MWTVLVLIFLSSSFSKSQVVSESPERLVPNKTWSQPPRTRASREANSRGENKTIETGTRLESLTTLPSGIPAAGTRPTEATTETTYRTEAGVTSATTSRATSRASPGPASSVPTAASQVVSTVPPRSLPPSTPRAHVPGTSTLLGAKTVQGTETVPGWGTGLGTVPGTGIMSGTEAKTTAALRTETMATTPQTRSPTSSSRPTTSNLTADLTPTVSPQTPNTTAQGPSPQTSTSQPVISTAVRPTATPSDAAPTTTTVASVTSVSTVPAATPRAETETHTAISTPTAEATSPTTQPPPTPSIQGAAGPALTPTPSIQGAAGPALTPTPGWGEAEASPRTVAAGPTLGSPEATKVPTTASCQRGTHGLALPAEPQAPSRSFLLAVLLLGVTLFFTVLVVFALQAYESYKKKDYTQVDYLINGMYADSEM